MIAAPPAGCASSSDHAADEAWRRRRLEMLREMAEMAMALARTAGNLAQIQAAAEAARDAAPAPPAAAALAASPAAAAPDPPRERPRGLPGARWAVIFARLCVEVRRLIILEAELAAEAPVQGARPPAAAPTGPSAAQRRLLSTAFAAPALPASVVQGRATSPEPDPRGPHLSQGPPRS